MEKITYYISAIALLFLCSCKVDNKTFVNAVHSIRIDNPVDIIIDDFVVNIDTIRLETNDESIMSDILDIHIMDNWYYVLSNKFTSVLIFNRDGKYISKINDTGKGPEEYIRINSLSPLRKVGKTI